MPDWLVSQGEHIRIDGGLLHVDKLLTEGLHQGDMVLGVYTADEKRSLIQNKKLWAMLTDFKPIYFNNRLWDQEHWKAFLMSAFNQEMPIVGLNGEPVMMGLSTSKLTKKRFAEFIEFIYAAGSQRGVMWSDPAMKVYEEYCGEDNRS